MQKPCLGAQVPLKLINFSLNLDIYTTSKVSTYSRTKVDRVFTQTLISFWFLRITNQSILTIVITLRYVIFNSKTTLFLF